MKKSLLLLTFCSLAFSCSREESTVHDAPGSILLKPQLTAEVDVQSRTPVPLTDFTGYTLTLDEREIGFPDDGIIPDVTPGKHSLRISNFTDFQPSFDDPRYEAIESDVIVESGKVTPVSVILTQANAGIFFDYDQSLQGSALENVILSVSQDQSILVYEDENREKTGYFTPGQVTVTAEANSIPVLIAGETARILNVAAKQLWKIRLSVSEATGSLELNVTVDELTDPTQIEEWELEQTVEGPSAPDFTKPWLITGKYYAPYETHSEELSQILTFEIEGNRLYMKGFDLFMESIPTYVWNAPQHLIFDYDPATFQLRFNHHDGELYSIRAGTLYYTTFIGTVRNGNALELLSLLRYNIYPVASIPMKISEDGTEITVGDISELVYDPETAAGLEFEDGPVTIGFGQRSMTGDLKNMAQIENLKITVIAD